MGKTFWFCAVGNAIALIYLLLKIGWKGLVIGFFIFLFTAVSTGYTVASEMIKFYKEDKDGK